MEGLRRLRLGVRPWLRRMGLTRSPGSTAGVEREAPDVLDISQDLVDELVAHAIETHPREACGVLVGPADQCRFDRLADA